MTTPIFQVFADPNWSAVFTKATGLKTTLVSSTEYVVTDAQGAKLVITGKNIAVENSNGYLFPKSGTFTGFQLAVNSTVVAAGTGYNLGPSALFSALYDYLYNDDKTAFSDMWFGDPVAITGTAAHIQASLAQLAYYNTHFEHYDTEIASIRPTSGKIVVSVAEVKDYPVLLDKIVGGFAVADTAVNIAGGLSSLAAVSSHITSITTTSGVVTVSTPAFVTGKAALNKIVGGFSVSDTAAHVESSLSALEADIAKIRAVDLTGASTPTLSLTAAQAKADARVVGKIAGDYVLDTHNANGSWTTTGHGGDLTIHDVAGVDTITAGGTLETVIFGASFGHATITDSHSHWLGAGHDAVELSKSEFGSLNALFHDASVHDGVVVVAGAHGDRLTLDGFSTLAQFHAALADFKLV